MEEKNKGGKRIGAGRKPLSVIDKKSVLTLYPSNRDIYKFGDKKKMAEELLKFIADYGKENRADNEIYGSVQDLTKHTNEIKPLEQSKTNFSINTTNAHVMPRMVLKSFEYWQQQKRECETPEQWEALKVQIEADPNLSRKQKDLLIKYS